MNERESLIMKINEDIAAEYLFFSNNNKKILENAKNF